MGPYRGRHLRSMHPDMTPELLVAVVVVALSIAGLVLFRDLSRRQL